MSEDRKTVESILRSQAVSILHSNGKSVDEASKLLESKPSLIPLVNILENSKKELKEDISKFLSVLQDKDEAELGDGAYILRRFWGLKWELNSGKAVCPSLYEVTSIEVLWNCILSGGTLAKAIIGFIDKNAYDPYIRARLKSEEWEPFARFFQHAPFLVFESGFRYAFDFYQRTLGENQPYMLKMLSLFELNKFGTTKKCIDFLRERPSFLQLLRELKIKSEYDEDCEVLYAVIQGKSENELQKMLSLLHQVNHDPKVFFLAAKYIGLEKLIGDAKSSNDKVSASVLPSQGIMAQKKVPSHQEMSLTPAPGDKSVQEKEAVQDATKATL